MKCNTWESRKENAILSVYGNDYNHLILAERDRMMEMLFEGGKHSEITRELGRDQTDMADSF